jgi:hypothetical protein
MIQVGTLAIKNAPLCEEIRQEKNNKFILLGVFSGDILVEKFPAHLGLSFYIEGTVTKVGQSSLWLRLSGPGEEDSALIEAQISTTKPHEMATLALPRLDVHMRGEGTFSLSASEDQKVWTPLIEKQVNQREGLWTLSSIEIVPPSEQSQPDAQEPSSPPEPSHPSGQARQRRKKAPARPRSRQ